jgi:hypothetical protein
MTESGKTCYKWYDCLSGGYKKSIVKYPDVDERPVLEELVVALQKKCADCPNKQLEKPRPAVGTGTA